MVYRPRLVGQVGGERGENRPSPGAPVVAATAERLR